MADWGPVREHFARHGGYRYLHFGEERRLIPGSYQLSVGSGQPGSGVAALSASYALRTGVKLPE